MLAGATILRLGLAALLSGTAAGLLLVASLLVGAVIAGADHGIGTGETPGPEMALLAVRLAVQAGAAVATLPAFVAGAVMTGLAARFEAARHLPAWAAAGAAVGAAFWLLVELVLGQLPYGTRPSAVDEVFLAAFLFGGGGSALVFRGTMRLTARLCATPPSDL
jgi:hypothetical protein